MTALNSSKFSGSPVVSDHPTGVQKIIREESQFFFNLRSSRFLSFLFQVERPNKRACLGPEKKTGEKRRGGGREVEGGGEKGNLRLTHPLPLLPVLRIRSLRVIFFFWIELCCWLIDGVKSGKYFFITERSQGASQRNLQWLGFWHKCRWLEIFPLF